MEAWRTWSESRPSSSRTARSPRDTGQQSGESWHLRPDRRLRPVVPEVQKDGGGCLDTRVPDGQADVGREHLSLRRGAVETPE